ncbi:MAG: protein serine/threonine phosphatase [Bacteroidetes bacterium]|jgi:serine phosphatase RsbU (regulator of sigma subunit)|nr:protein serine/threonine phosphatase [Bacteroidota bacterium]
MKKQLVFLILLFLSFLPLSAQPDPDEDSLKNSLSISQNDTNKVKTLNRLAYLLTEKDPKTSVKYAEEALLLSEKLNYKLGQAKACVYYANALNNTKNTNNVYKYLEKAATIFTELNDKSGLAWVYSNLGGKYAENGEYETALKYHLKNLVINQETGNKHRYAWALNGISTLYIQMGQYANAEKYTQECLKEMTGLKDSAGIASAYNNYGMLNDYSQKNDKAIEYYSKALDIHSRLGNQVDVIGCLNNIAVIHVNNKNYDAALPYFLKANKISEEIDYPSGLATNYINMGEVYIGLKQYDKAILFIGKGLDIANSLGFTDFIAEGHRLLYEAYYQKSDYKNALVHKNRYTDLKDSLLNVVTNKQIAEMGVKYESDKKEQENKLLQAENQLSTETIKQQRVTAYFIVAGLILVTLLAIFIFKGLRQQRKANTIISAQKEEVENQKHIVEEKQKEIMDSIRYAERIQRALLAGKSVLDDVLKEENHFVLFKPKDIVSGDFYWATEAERSSLQGQPDYKLSTIDHKLFYLAVCDSTGHGVPGAFMCLLNIGFLSEAIKEKNILQPNEVFNYVRHRLVESISKEGQRDGFDGILIRIDQENNTITYSAANNAPVLVRNSEIIDLACDKMPVGMGEKKEDFTLRTIDVHKGDTLYLYTDGFADQFGGPKGKKFKYKSLNDLLLTISSLSLTEQKQKLETAFESWKGELEQVDDVCVIGIRL